MNKYYITNPSDIDRYISLDVSGFIFGIEKFSSEFNNYLSLDEISLMCDKCKNNNKDIIIFLNRLYFEHEIDELKEIIKELSKLNVIIGFTDDSVLNILDEIIELSNQIKYEQNPKILIESKILMLCK